jgi:hypothetical protein
MSTYNHDEMQDFAKFYIKDSLKETVNNVLEYFKSINISLNIDFDNFDLIRSLDDITKALAEASNLLASANTQAAITDANKNAIDNILLNAHSNFDTFIELFNLTSGNRTSVLAAITALQTSLTATAGSKVNRTQTNSNTLVYLDQQNLTSTFKLVVDNGQLTIVEV